MQLCGDACDQKVDNCAGFTFANNPSNQGWQASPCNLFLTDGDTVARVDDASVSSGKNEVHCFRRRDKCYKMNVHIYVESNTASRYVKAPYHGVTLPYHYPGAWYQPYQASYNGCYRLCIDTPEVTDNKLLVSDTSDNAIRSRDMDFMLRQKCT